MAVHRLRHFLEAGKRLVQPLHCPDIHYDLMLSCWRSRPSDRPNFVTIEHQFVRRAFAGKTVTSGSANPFFAPVPPAATFPSYLPEFGAFGK
ncbi:hypothetical protein GPALN_014559 [Globodera pallida]|nr:hypothetical protein GPALN_014559 [Globodera pallida]